MNLVFKYHDYITEILVVGKLLLTVLLITLSFAVAIPNCIVPATASHPQYFAWSGLFGPFLVSSIIIYCVWFWR
jgi:uncharacterized membrane protein YkgB